MVRRNTPQTLGEALSGLINSLGLQSRIDETRIIEAWATLAGPQINAVTEKAWVRSGRLFVRITSSPWRHELHLHRRAWRDRLNTHLGSTLVRDIVFR